MTFTFDDETVGILKNAATRLRKPQSMVVREAIREYAERSGRLSDEERRHMLGIFDRMIARIPVRKQKVADSEIAAIRAARKAGGRRTRVG
jgi:hypothetical protein